MPAAIYASPPASPVSHRKPSIQLLTRNIDQVLLGSILFDTWYYSPYPDTIILRPEQQQAPPVTTSTHAATRHGVYNTMSSSALKAEIDGPITGTPGACPRLHVCPRCFAYTPNPLHYLTHLKHHCSLKADPAWRTVKEQSPASSTENDGTGGVPATATKVYDHDGYAVWEVDGEVEKFYCQNLSLFGKLFLEQKSVFFDVSGFMYYVLTYTPPPGTSVLDTEPSPTTNGIAGPPRLTGRGNTRKRPLPVSVPKVNKAKASADDWITEIHAEAQTLGFFSKEKLSWDSNNLACILIFPPYQHRQLGKLLMSVSYKLSGWEWVGGVIGGPEKPLSAMGKKSYSRFWAERVARYLLGETRDADGRVVLQRSNAAKKKLKGVGKMKKKEILTVKEIGERTGMLAEDVVVALTAMGVCERPGKRVLKNSATKKEELSNGDNSQHSHQPISGEGDKEAIINMTVKRSRIREWVERNGVDLKDPVAEEGFLGEWAMSDIDSDIEMVDEASG